MEINFEEILENVLQKRIEYFFIGCSMIVKENQSSDEAIILNINGHFGIYETNECGEYEKYKMDKYEQLRFLLVIKKLIANPFIDDKIIQLSKIFQDKELNELKEQYEKL